MQITRRSFLAKSASVGTGLLVANGCLCRLLSAEPASGARIALPGELKVKYFGCFSELPVGSVKARGWIQGWLDRQVQGLTVHPENLGYPYDTCMFAGKIPPPAIRHGENCPKPAD